jgi:hypothetical protein
MTAGDGKTAVLPGFENLPDKTRGGVLGMKDELERLTKERAQLNKQITVLDRRIATLERRMIKALNAH